MSKRNDPNDPQGWFAKISQQALEMPLLPNSRTSAKDPAWKTETGRRVRSALVITKILVITSFSIAVAGLVVGLAVSDPSFRWLVSVAGAVLSALLAVSVGCSGVRTLWLRKIGTTLTVAAIVVALAFIPWLGQSPSILHVGPYQELLGPPGPRLILVVLLLATASLIPPGSFRAGALTVSLAALGTGLAILEGFTWVIGSDPVAWFGSEVGLPPVTATSLALLGPAILLAKPEIPQISAALRAGTSVRVYWATAGWLTLVLVAALGLLRFCLEAGIIWQESVAYSWLFLSVGVGIVLIIQSHKTAQLELLANAVRRELGLLTENASDVVWIADPNGECVWVSRSLTAALGWEPSDWLGQPGSSFVAPEWLDRYHNATQKAEASQQRHTVELQYVNSEGEKIWMSSRVVQERDPDGQLVSVVHSLRIVEEEVKARQALVRSENTLQIALEVSPIGLALLDSQRRIFRTNQAFEEVTGRAAEFVKGLPIEEIFPPDERTEMPTNMVAGQLGQQAGPPLFRVAAPQGPVRWVTCEIAEMGSEDPTNILGFVCQTRDVTNEVLNLEELQFRAFHDRLTGLMNRDSLEKMLTTVSAQAAKTNTSFGVLFCDVDHFKKFNDTWGHSAGDLILKTTAERIRRTLRPDDFVARIGGDEFIVVLDPIGSVEDCAKVAEVIRGQVRKPIELGGDTCSVDLSVGVAISHQNENVTDMADRADSALYRAKQRGRNQTVAV